MKIITLECRIFVVYILRLSQDDSVSKFKRDRLPRKIFSSENSSSTHLSTLSMYGRDVIPAFPLENHVRSKKGTRRRITRDKLKTIEQGATIHFT